MMKTLRIDMSKKHRHANNVSVEVYTFAELTKNIYGQEVEFIESFEVPEEAVVSSWDGYPGGWCD